MSLPGSMQGDKNEAGQGCGAALEGGADDPVRGSGLRPHRADARGQSGGTPQGRAGLGLRRRRPAAVAVAEAHGCRVAGHRRRGAGRPGRRCRPDRVLDRHPCRADHALPPRPARRSCARSRSTSTSPRSTPAGARSAGSSPDSDRLQPPLRPLLRRGARAIRPARSASWPGDHHQPRPRDPRRSTT